jgi:hypothetical protein
MKVFYPALVTSAIFFGAIVVNLHERYYGTALFISLLAIPSIILQVLLTQKNFDIVGYILLLIPIILVYIGYTLGIKKNEVITVSTTTTSKTIEKFKNSTPERIEAKMT